MCHDCYVIILNAHEIFLLLICTAVFLQYNNSVLYRLQYWSVSFLLNIVLSQIILLWVLCFEQLWAFDQFWIRPWSKLVGNAPNIFHLPVASELSKIIYILSSPCLEIIFLYLNSVATESVLLLQMFFNH